MKTKQSSFSLSLMSGVVASLLVCHAHAAFDGKIIITPANPTSADTISIQITQTACRTAEESNWKDSDFKINLSFDQDCTETVPEQDFKTVIGPLQGDQSYRIRFGSKHPGLETPVLRDEVKFDVLPAGQSSSLKGQHEAPAADADVSGVSVIRGWVCDANSIEIAFDGQQRFPVAYGTERGDTREICGDVNNGYGMTINMALLGEGLHTLQVFVDGTEHIKHTINVHTLGDQAFLRGKSYQTSLPDFPERGQSTRVKWSEADQNFVILGVN